ncbi:MAG: hypothetical protein KDD56_06695, partial [Bdellovibrionales bacterium]|nr:hypothetical protein [Bdellovibrionales bacterium]
MGSIDTANQDRGTEIVTADMLAGATIGQQSRICKILGLNENGTKLADLQTSIVELAKKLDSLDDIETPEALGEAKKLATQMRSIADFIALSDSIGVKQEGIKFTVTTKPPKADMTLMDVFKEL